MKRMCRTCGILFSGDGNHFYCDQTHANAHNFGQSEPYRDEADAYNFGGIAEYSKYMRDRVMRLRALIRIEHVEPPFDVNDDLTTEFAIKIAELEAGQRTAPQVAPDIARVVMAAEKVSGMQYLPEYWYDELMKALNDLNPASRAACEQAASEATK